MYLFNKKENSIREETKRIKGFTVGELLLFLVLLGILIALLIPLFITARERATLKSTMADMRIWGEAITCYIADHSVAPINPRGVMHYKKPILKELSPYLNAIQVFDWWGHPFRIWIGKAIGQYGITTTNDKEFIIASFGKDGIIEGWKYDPKSPNSGFFNLKELEDFEKDLVMWNNKFIRCPKSK